MLNILFTILIILSPSYHPIHVSVCEIEYDEERKALEITQRIFLNDLEEAIKQELGEPNLDIAAPDKGRTTDELVASYLYAHFKVNVNGKDVSYSYLGSEMEADAIYCYLEVDKVKKMESLEISNTVLFARFEDQINLVHVKVDEKVRSMKLTRDHTQDILKYK